MGRAVRARLVLVLLSSAGAASPACDAPPEVERDPPKVLASAPVDGEEGTLRRGPFTVWLDRALIPWSVNRANVRVESGATMALLSMRFDVLDHAIVAAPFGTDALEPNVVFRLVVDGVRDLEDRPLAEPFVARFRTGSEEGALWTPPSASFGAAAPILTAHCTGDGCHGPGTPPLGLDLSSAEGIRSTAIGQISTELPQGPTGDESALGGLALGGLYIIDVVGGSGRPATSYLIYKIVGDPHVVGERMPPPPRDALSYEEMRTIDAWIVAGAPLP